jgi:hypothetical protein
MAAFIAYFLSLNAVIDILKLEGQARHSDLFTGSFPQISETLA